MAQALLAWLVMYAGLMALSGFILIVLRGATGRAWSLRTVLRMSATFAFVGSTGIWLAIQVAGS